jgi:uncharacterized protein (UPF0261 family)
MPEPARTVAVLATLDTKGREVAFLREQIKAQGCRALLLDIGLLGTPATRADVTREEVCAAGGKPLAELLRAPTRQAAAPVVVAGAGRLLAERIARGTVHAVVGLGGTQGTSTCTAIMQALPYGFPKVMVSTVAAGDVSAFVGIKDITMMFSVGDILGLNPLLRKILANAAGAACGMARVALPLERQPGGRPVIGMTNLGVLTDGALRALARLQAKGYEVVVFHAVGSGGRAMEQMLRDGILGAVFDYALGEITDEVFHGLRAGGPERLSVAGALGLPQVLVPGGAEHVGLFVPPDTVPERWRDHLHVFHSPVILAPRCNADELRQVAREIARRLGPTRGRAVMFLPRRGTSRYGVAGGPLHDPAGDRAFFDELVARLPKGIEVQERDAGAEDPAFVDECVDRLVALIEAGAPRAGAVRP